jgi:hypothetical protein
VKSGDTAVETTNVATWVADKSHYDYTEQTGDVKVYYTWNSENETYDTKSYKVTVNDDGQTVETEIVETAESDND